MEYYLLLYIRRIRDCCGRATLLGVLESDGDGGSVNVLVTKPDRGVNDVDIGNCCLAGLGSGVTLSIGLKFDLVMVRG